MVRWRLDGRDYTRGFRTKGEAERYRARLLVASESGSPFDSETGEPTSWQPPPTGVSVHDWARRWISEQWPEWAPRTRHSAIEALARFVPLAIGAGAPAPPRTVRQHLMQWLEPHGDTVDAAAARWLEQHCLTLDQLTKERLATVDRRLGLRDDGEPLSAWTAGRFRKVSRACIRRAVELGVIDEDPWPPPPRGRSRRKAAKTRKAVNVRALPEPVAMARVLTEMISHQPASQRYAVMTAIAYYAGLRPSEVVMLRRRALELPGSGWGAIEVTESDVSFDEPGEPKTGNRTVPIPPQLVSRLRAWLEKNEFGPDDLLFRTRNGRRPTSSNWSRSLHRALERGELPPMRIYDCRHAAATTWLRAGVPLGEVAKRMGHSVETLVSTYVGALEGDEALANARIEEALRLADEEPRPVTEEQVPG